MYIFTTFIVDSFLVLDFSLCSDVVISTLMMGSNSSVLTNILILLYRNPFSFWFLALGLAWLAWYYIRFTIIPILRPNDPKELPYFVPS